MIDVVLTAFGCEGLIVMGCILPCSSLFALCVGDII